MQIKTQEFMKTLTERVESSKTIVNNIKDYFEVEVNPWVNYETSFIVYHHIGDVKFELMFTIFDKTVGLNWIKVDLNGDIHSYSGCDPYGKCKVSSSIEEFGQSFIESICVDAYDTCLMYFQIEKIKKENMFGFQFED